MLFLEYFIIFCNWHNNCYYLAYEKIRENYGFKKKYINNRN